MSEVAKCCKRTKLDRWPYLTTGTCGKPAKVEVDGKHYCGVHDPVRAKERRNKRWAERQQGFERASKIRQLEAAAPDLLAALQEIVQKRLEKASSPAEADGSDGRYARARAAIAKATGEP